MIGRWQTGPEPLFVRFGHTVFVASREDAWYLLGGAITGEQMKRFRDLALLVLEEDNPAFELARDQRWLANLHGKTHSLSADFRCSIVETLGLIATYPTADDPIAGGELKGTVRWVLERALPENATWQRWASFGHNLPIVAEADPELFLRRVEADLRSDAPELPKLFQDQSHSMFGGSIHSDLLWALEGLAWSPEYLSRVAVCLARLAARDPGGTYANRPSNSLREIFLLWLWHTNASLDDRIKALSEVIQAEPVVGWRLLQELLPSGTSSLSHNTHMPRWRPWAEGWSREKIHPEVPRYAIAIAEVTIQAAATDPQRWSEILDGILRVSTEVTDRVFSQLEAVCAVSEGNEEARFPLWKALSKLLARHERYADAPWVFDKEIRDRMAAIRDRLEPTDAVCKHHWLFNYRVELPGIDMLKDHSAHETAVNEAQLAALREIHAREGAAGVFRLLELAAQPNIVGWLIGANNLLDWGSVQLPDILDSSDDRRLNFINAFIRSRFEAGGWKSLTGAAFTQWSVRQIATFARCLPFRSDVWDWVHQFGADVESEYWQRVRGYLHKPNLDELRRATASLIGVGRSFTAITVLQYAHDDKSALPSALVAEVLEAGIGGQNTEAPDRSSQLDYAVQQLVKLLQQDKNFDRLRLARIEWGFLSLIQ